MIAADLNPDRTAWGLEAADFFVSREKYAKAGELALAVDPATPKEQARRDRIIALAQRHALSAPAAPKRQLRTKKIKAVALAEQPTVGQD